MPNDTKIDAALNIVMEIEASDGSSLFVHSTPISRQVFEKYFLLLGKTYAALVGQGLGFVSGPRVAALLLKKIAVDAGEWDGPAGVEFGLMAEIRRLTNVVTPSDKGWVVSPYQDAIDKKLISDEDAGEVEGILAFFTVISAMSRRREIPEVLGLLRMHGALAISQNSMEFSKSLKPSTEEKSSPQEAVQAVTSSVPH